MSKSLFLIRGAYFVLFLAIINESSACTRVVYQGPNGTVITARSMDWRDEIPANIWVFPRGIKRNGEVGPNSINWTSKYGSVVTSAFDISSTDGMNERGLVANLLWLAESEYPAYDGKAKGLSIAAWVQYVLDNFASVSEAVDYLSKESFMVVSANIPGTDRFATLHLAISDASGDNAIFEYIGGKLVIHHDRSYTVMTNSPIFDKQLALNEYWKEIGGFTMLPGTNRASDRFVRACFYVQSIPKTDNTRIAIASMFSVIRNCSVPFGISSPTEPNISTTRWRSVSDQKNLVYYFETTLTPNTFWVDMKQLDFSEKSPVKRLRVDNNQIYSGNAVQSFVATQPFKFAGL